MLFLGKKQDWWGLGAVTLLQLLLQASVFLAFYKTIVMSGVFGNYNTRNYWRGKDVRQREIGAQSEI